MMMILSSYIPVKAKLFLGFSIISDVELHQSQAYFLLWWFFSLNCHTQKLFINVEAMLIYDLPEYIRQVSINQAWISFSIVLWQFNFFKSQVPSRNTFHTRYTKIVFNTYKHVGVSEGSFVCISIACLKNKDCLLIQKLSHNWYRSES